MSWTIVLRPSANRFTVPASRAAVQSGSSLQALTVAALALPGLTPVARAATGDSLNVQYGFYEEGERELVGNSYSPNPIRNDNLQANGALTLFDRFKLTVGYTQDTWSGATPITTAPYGALNLPVAGASPAYVTNNDNLRMDNQLRTYTLDAQGNYFRDPRLVHMVATASPETRKQGDFSLGYEWDEAALAIGGGLSLENDYESRFVSVNGHRDFNQKLTTISAGLSYTNSDIHAVPNASGLTYIDKSIYLNAVSGPSMRRENGTVIFSGEREDWSTHLGLSKVINKDAVLETSLGYTRSTGFLENPYKVVSFAFFDPNQVPDPVDGLLSAFVQPVLENRPDARNQWTWSLRYAQYLQGLDGALHLDYRFYNDDWGINAHTFEAQWGQELGGGWTLTPRLRYYSQDAADFYRPYFLFNQAVPKISDPTVHLDFSKIPVRNYSSDHRLSGFGALSGGLSLSKKIARGAATLEASMEYYTHEGGLKLGGGGEAGYADFDSLMFNVGLKIDLSANLSLLADSALPNAAGNADAGSSATHNHDQHAHHGHSPHGPAGVMIDHMLGAAGDYMFGYLYLYSQQGGATLQGSTAVADAAIVSRGCGEFGCGVTPRDMGMHMHMLDLMYAPTAWLNLMLMPQIMDMDMDPRPLAGGVQRVNAEAHHHGGASGAHNSGGLGDTRMYSLLRLYDSSTQHMHLGLGLSAPTGDVGQVFSNGELMHYHMQLGSGTWDFLPSLTYTGNVDRWSWGAQINGIHRLEDRNAKGYALGDLLQTTAWAGYRWSEWITTTIRGIYSTQGRLEGSYNAAHGDTSPVDFPNNYGGRFWDVGFGLSMDVPVGEFAGNRLSVEWLQPVSDDVNGFQLQREGGLAATWSVAF
jgi:hypothetical protein